MLLFLLGFNVFWRSSMIFFGVCVCFFFFYGSWFENILETLTLWSTRAPKTEQQRPVGGVFVLAGQTATRVVDLRADDEWEKTSLCCCLVGFIYNSYWMIEQEKQKGMCCSVIIKRHQSPVKVKQLMRTQAWPKCWNKYLFKEYFDIFLQLDKKIDSSHICKYSLKLQPAAS